jgi:hypothetical protein
MYATCGIRPHVHPHPPHHHHIDPLSGSLLNQHLAGGVLMEFSEPPTTARLQTHATSRRITGHDRHVPEFLCPPHTLFILFTAW